MCVGRIGAGKRLVLGRQLEDSCNNPHMRQPMGMDRTERSQKKDWQDKLTDPMSAGSGPAGEGPRTEG